VTKISTYTDDDAIISGLEKLGIEVKGTITSKQIKALRPLPEDYIQKRF